jgi:3-methyladenine DNA glycosylase/8-oxoguanine DNA glycosylase
VSTEIRLPLVGAGGEPVDLWRTLTSHGFADLSPLRLDEDARTLEITVGGARGRPRRVRVGPGSAGHALVTVPGPRPGTRAVSSIVDGMRHVLRLDQDLSAFYELVADDPDLAWVAAGAGRMLRSPTVFEDVVKTVCTTNCAWSATKRMVDALVTHLGEPAVGGGGGPLTNAFPSAAAMSAAPKSFYRDTVRAGYRTEYLIGLARLVERGEIDLEAMARADPEELPDDELEAMLLALPGVGPYAAAHIMMTIGRNSRLILDSWSRPAYTRLAGRRTVPTDLQITRRFRRYGAFAGLAFWLFVTRDWVD